jgi:hypothetical protein
MPVSPIDPVTEQLLQELVSFQVEARRNDNHFTFPLAGAVLTTGDEVKTQVSISSATVYLKPGNSNVIEYLVAVGGFPLGKGKLTLTAGTAKELLSQGSLDLRLYHPVPNLAACQIVQLSSKTGTACAYTHDLEVVLAGPSAGKIKREEPRPVIREVAAVPEGLEKRLGDLEEKAKGYDALKKEVDELKKTLAQLKEERLKPEPKPKAPAPLPLPSPSSDSTVFTPSPYQEELAKTLMAHCVTTGRYKEGGKIGLGPVKEFTYFSVDRTIDVTSSSPSELRQVSTIEGQSRGAIQQLYRKGLEAHGQMFNVTVDDLRRVPTPLILYLQLMDMGSGPAKAVEVVQEHLGFSFGQIKTGQKQGLLELNLNGSVVKTKLHELLHQVFPYMIVNRERLYSQITTS